MLELTLTCSHLKLFEGRKKLCSSLGSIPRGPLEQGTARLGGLLESPEQLQLPFLLLPIVTKNQIPRKGAGPCFVQEVGLGRGLEPQLLQFSKLQSTLTHSTSEISMAKFYIYWHRLKI